MANPSIPEKPPESKSHYHIRWSSDSSLDWKPFPTQDEARELAESLKSQNESYIIVERDGECERCVVFKSKTFRAREAVD